MNWLTVFIISSCAVIGFCYGDEVTCGTVLKLMNINEGSRLHSHEVKYGSGSGQQSVTAVQASDDVNSHWQIFPGVLTCSKLGRWDEIKVSDAISALKESCNRGEAIKCGDKIRLKHLTTGCFLHTHHFHAPLSKHYQVSIIFIKFFFNLNLDSKPIRLFWFAVVK